MEFEMQYSLTEIHHVATQLVNQFGKMPVWTLTGDLGAGKTTLAAAIATTMGSIDEVSSPTYSIINEYALGANNFNYERMYHMDLYRLKDEAEVYDVGILEIFEQQHTFTLIEWPQIASHLMPNNTVSLDIHTNADNTRTIKITHI